MTDQLSLYNGALIKIGEPRLSALTDEGKPRRALDDVYHKTVKACLEAGMWNFAMRFAEIENTPSEATGFGYQFVFNKPDDWLRTAGVFGDGHGNSPLLYYDDRASFWLADTPIIYVRFISIDQDYGMDLGMWPESFVEFVECSLAVQICEDVTGSNEKKDRLEKAVETAYKRAANRDAMNEPVTRFAPTGRLVASRGSWSRGERGRY